MAERPIWSRAAQGPQLDVLGIAIVIAGAVYSWGELVAGHTSSAVELAAVLAAGALARLH